MEMEFHTIFGLGGIIIESIHVFSTNPKAMAFFTLLTPTIYSLLYLSNIFSIKPLIKDLVLQQTSLILAGPTSPDFANLLAAAKSDVTLFFGLEWFFLLATAASSLFFAAATVLTSAVARSGKHSLSLRELLLRTLRTIKNPLVTSFYTTLLGLGYICLVFLVLVPVDLLFLGSAAVFLAASAVLAAAAALFCAHLSVVWTLALVVSVVEDRSGIEALGKARELVKGSERLGFCMNVVIGLVALIVYYGMRLLTVEGSEWSEVVVGLVVMNAMCLVKLFGLVGYTVLYYQCKKKHGEEIELLSSIDYTKVATVPFITEDMA